MKGWMAFAWIGVGLLLAAGGPALAEGDPLFEGAPPAPPGYDDYRNARMAVVFGVVERMELEVGEIPESIVFHDDVVYSEPDGAPLSMDIYVPKEAQTPPPVMLFIHGGGWSKGKKEDYAFYNVAFAKLGYATASVQYRLSPEHHFPAAIHDVKCAMTWLKANGPRLGFDGSRMVLIGGSAGGHLALLAGYSQDPELACPAAGKDAEPAAAGIVNLYGVVDCTTPVAQEAHQVIDFIGASYSEAAARYAQSSPIHHLDAGDPPTLTIHGTIDELVPVSQADTLHAKLKELGIANHYDRVEGWPHSMDLAKPINDRCRFLVQRFLEKYLPLEEKAE